MSSPSQSCTRLDSTQSQAPPGNFPAPGHANGARPDTRLLQALAGLTGTTVTLTTKTGIRYEGVVGSTSNEGDTTGVTLKDVKDITAPGAPLKDSIFIAATNIENYSSGPADAKPTNGDTFRTDTDISGKKAQGRERELQAWVPSNDIPVASSNTDEDTFGTSNATTSWDQFSVNEQLFGVKASFDEEVYTTKLDRNAPDFKEREREAQRIANEILGATTNNPHVAEERGVSIDDSGVNEEDKYGAVVRGSNAYVPPGARKAAVAAGTNGAPSLPKPEIPKVSVNGPDGNAVASSQSPIPSKASSPAPNASANKPPADPLPAFRDFVTNEKQRLTQKRQALVKSEMDKRMAELLNKPIPEDLVPILAKDEEKQKQIKEKATRDAQSNEARAIGASTPATASRGVLPGGKLGDGLRKPAAPLPASKTVANNLDQSSSSSAQKPTGTSSGSATPGTASASKPGESAAKKIPMVIQAIPPFRGSKGKPATAPSGTQVKVTTSSSNGTSHAAPMSPATANRLNVNAPSFRSKGSVSPSLSAASASASVSPKPKADSAPATPNPFFGARTPKKSNPVNVKDDFNPFKHNKVADASQVAAMWPFNGKRYMQLYPPPPHQPPQHPPHMAPLVPSPMPPPPYEEDPAAHAARGYVYAYPPYGYPGQPMMPGMAPPGPGGYMPGHFMQPMPYPPGMPPPNAMYSPAMGQMPPPQPYGMPPPPGPYPPPPNGGQPRPSMPPTPIPAHAHPYYHHQSPQMQHAVPYPMMMPPPPGAVPPHPYDGSQQQPVQMGGHA
ncbi:hypothetical protein EST38_g319 [Candolleomyces aberdarensis]|uniref:LsmAD domain-containing protein n=1 Tax=Candolleomyces aberdarensis TaxID=2316362 RepID=A0A4Q2E0Y1_9AGAR|nr:hypothetical protein EST38_g319 [Candolleomyces aberdarensis]